MARQVAEALRGLDQPPVLLEVPEVTHHVLPVALERGEVAERGVAHGLLDSAFEIAHDGAVAAQPARQVFLDEGIVGQANHAGKREILVEEEESGF